MKKSYNNQILSYISNIHFVLVVGWTIVGYLAVSINW